MFTRVVQKTVRKKSSVMLKAGQVQGDSIYKTMSEELLYYFQDYRVVYKTTRDISCIISVIFTGVVSPWILARKILHLSHIYRDCIRDSPGFVHVFQPRFEELEGGQSGKIMYFIFSQLTRQGISSFQPHSVEHGTNNCFQHFFISVTYREIISMTVWSVVIFVTFRGRTLYWGHVKQDCTIVSTLTFKTSHTSVTLTGTACNALLFLHLDQRD